MGHLCFGVKKRAPLCLIAQLRAVTQLHEHLGGKARVTYSTLAFFTSFDADHTR